jgi:hypothetical protein
MLFVNIDHVPTISLPSISYFNFRAYLQTRYSDQYVSGRPCENSLQRRRVEAVKIFIRKLWRMLWYLKVFKNSVLVFICKLVNQKRQRLPIHRCYSHTDTLSLEMDTAVLPWSILLSVVLYGLLYFNRLLRTHFNP